MPVRSWQQTVLRHDQGPDKPRLSMKPQWKQFSLAKDRKGVPLSSMESRLQPVSAKQLQVSAALISLLLLRSVLTAGEPEPIKDDNSQPHQSAAEALSRVLELQNPYVGKIG